MSKRTMSCIVLSAALAAAWAVAARPAYPEAQRSAHVDTYHGVEVPDPYRWLEDVESPQTREWVDAQSEMLASYLDDRRRAVLQEKIVGLTGFEIYGNPVKAGSTYFYTRSVPGQPSGEVLAESGRGQGQGQFRVILPAQEFAAQGERIVGVSPSPDGSRVAYQVVEGPSNWRQLRVRSVANGKDLSDRLSGLHSVSSAVSWTLDGQGFYYVHLTRPEADADAGPGATRILYHRLGTPQDQDTVVFEQPEHPGWLLTHRLTLDGRFLVVTASEGGSTHTRVFYRQESGKGAMGQAFQPLFAAGDAGYSFLAARDRRFWFFTTHSAPRGRIVAVDLDQPDTLREIVPQAEETIAGGSMVGGNAVSIRGHRIIISYVRDARPLVRIHELDGTFAHEVTLPDIGAIWGGFAGSPDDPEVFYTFLSLTDPSTVYRLDVRTGESSVHKRPDLPFDPNEFVTRQVFYHSKDGTRVPMFITHRRGFEPDGTAPAFMYGYGAWGWIAFPWYQPHVLAMLQQGWVYALPGIRGGGEYGESWHQAGIRRNKQNAIDDYVYAARWLVDNGFTSADRMVANGGSASGALAASAVIQRPDLFGAAVIDIPGLDMLRYDRLTPTRHRWTEEMGSVDDEGDFRALLGYSPYHNVRPGVCFPPFLTLIGEGDELAPPPHGYKFTAALQHAQGCDHPVMMKLIPGAGHSHGTTAAEVARTWADAITFIEQAISAREDNRAAASGRHGVP